MGLILGYLVFRQMLDAGYWILADIVYWRRWSLAKHQKLKKRNEECMRGKYRTIGIRAECNCSGEIAAVLG